MNFKLCASVGNSMVMVMCSNGTVSSRFNKLTDDGQIKKKTSAETEFVFE